MSSDQKWILAAFVFYLAVMLLIGVLYFKRTKNTEDYFLGGRSLGGWVAALAAHGFARRDLCGRYWADMDCSGIGYGHVAQLDTGILPVAEIYCKGGQLINTAGLF